MLLYNKCQSTEIHETAFKKSCWSSEANRRQVKWLLEIFLETTFQCVHDGRLSCQTKYFWHFG